MKQKEARLFNEEVLMTSLMNSTEQALKDLPPDKRTPEEIIEFISKKDKLVPIEDLISK